MKKTITIICFLILLWLPITTHAANIEFKLVADKNNYTVKEGQTIEMTMQLGNFISISKNTSLGYSATLSYDENIFENVEILSENGWNVLYNDITHTIQGDTDRANPNTVIAKIKLTLKKNDNSKRNEITTIRLKNILISDGNFEIKQQQEVEINITNNAVEETTQTIKDLVILTGENSQQAMMSNENEKLPYVGLQRNIIIAIAILLLILIIIFRMKARKIK